ncbi:GNAT family N-acetyltransferase [Chitiniphilus purpureus]|uniref:L-ornithine N(alpha)-acyltransferase n=1 Tax=Chitiniphilus purpureus TaxID=2981137 RepID=A0ABY6DSX8_9NEIS|nr:GNAT family N-acyltransferase [Chitiniphilus sp. CD1]UXY16586.1 GNAT family N-acetyltransferase [Chitiniphilus sp. CD1]
MLQQLHSDTAKHARRLSLALANTQEQIRAAQALRHKVFVEEMGARLTPGTPGLDQDLFDPYCEHLIVQDDETGEVVGTYRILTPHQARRLGSYYADTEFDLTRLQHLRSQFVEVGRSCVHPDYRNGATIALLWSGLAEYMRRHGYQYLIGCASISLSDGGHCAASLYRKLIETAYAPIEWRVFPRCPLPLAALDQRLPVPTPPLIKGYLRAGALICGEPAWDPDFNTADLFVLLPMRRIDTRYAKHFVR